MSEVVTVSHLFLLGFVFPVLVRKIHKTVQVVLGQVMHTLPQVVSGMTVVKWRIWSLINNEVQL